MGEKLTRVRNGLAWVFLPMQAVRSVKESGQSISRSLRMLKRGRMIVADDDADLSPIRQADVELLEEGREVVLKMEEHDRFAFMATALKWSESELEAQKKALNRSHTIRISLLYFLVMLYPFLCFIYGWKMCIYLTCTAIYLSLMCLKATCLYVQMEERALWSFRSLWSRPHFWLLKKSVWFLS